MICIFIKGLRDAHNSAEKVYEKHSKTLFEVIKLLEKLNTAQHVTATLTQPMVNMMSNDDNCFACCKKGHIGHNCSWAQCYSSDDYAYFTKDCPKQSVPSGNPIIIIDLSPTCIIATTTGTGHTASTTDSGKGTTLTCQDHTIDFSMKEAPIITQGMHPTPYPLTTAVLITALQTGTPEDIPAGISHTNTGATHPDTHRAEATHDTTPLIIVDLAPGTPW